MGRREDGESIRSIHLRQSAPHCHHQVRRSIAPGVREGILDEMHDDLGVRLGDEAVAAVDKCLAEFPEVLDDAVMDHHEPAAAVGVRMGVHVVGLPVGRPARVAQAEVALRGSAVQRLEEPGQTTLGLGKLNLPFRTEHRDSRRIVSTVLQPLQALQ